MKYVVSRLELFELLRSHNLREKSEQENFLVRYLVAQVKMQREHEKIKSFARDFLYKIGQRWKNAKRIVTEFKRKNKLWLMEKMVFASTKSKGQVKRGRPKKAYYNSSLRTKQRASKGIREELGANELAFAAQVKLRAEGRCQEAKLVHEAVLTTPNRAAKISSAWSKPLIKYQPVLGRRSTCAHA